MWVVRVGGDLYARSAGGPDRAWYRPAVTSRAGRVEAGGTGADVSFMAAAPETSHDIDAAYHATYDRYGPAIVGHGTGPAAHAVTIRLIKTAE